MIAAGNTETVETEPKLAAERVLIVEDDAAARVGLEQLVRSWGFIAESASIGNEMLLSDYMVAHAKSRDEKMFYLSQALESIRATVAVALGAGGDVVQHGKQRPDRDQRRGPGLVGSPEQRDDDHHLDRGLITGWVKPVCASAHLAFVVRME